MLRKISLLNLVSRAIEFVFIRPFSNVLTMILSRLWLTLGLMLEGKEMTMGIKRFLPKFQIKLNEFFL